MNQNRGGIGTGLVLIGIGLLALLFQLGLGDLFGEAIVLTVGVVFLLLRFVGKVEWAIYPGAFTSTVGAVIFLAARDVNMDIFWPLFVIAPGVSFLIIRTISPGDQWAIFPGLLVTGIGLIMFLFSTGLVSWFYLDILSKSWPVALILLGLLIIVRTGKPRGPEQR
jgi:hypothetical protein